jgi:oligoendopeptidase F
VDAVQKNPSEALNNYCMALSLGGTKTLPELYQMAGLSFDFSPEKIKELMVFVKEEMNKLDN